MTKPKYQLNERVQIFMVDGRTESRYHGALGIITMAPKSAEGLYQVRMDDPLLTCVNWSESFIFPAPVKSRMSKQELALTAAYHTFKFYQSQHEEKGKGQKARANQLLADMMKEALDDLTESS